MTPPKVVIVDYGLGNLRSVAAAIGEVGGVPEITSDFDAIVHAERIILPGVGAFGLAAKRLETSGIGSAVLSATGHGVPLLGICLGMQLLFDRGNEFGWSSGLGLVKGDVLPVFDRDATEQPRGTHIGWRPLSFSSLQAGKSLFQGIDERNSFYFVHSFSAHAVDADNVTARVTYGTKYLAAAVEMSNVMGVQFHPEKSGPSGLRVLRNFIHF